MPTTHADLEINILRPRPESCQIELRFTNPRSEAETTPVRSRPGFYLPVNALQLYDQSTAVV